MSREYGWTDDQILDLTVRRFRQITAAIRRRKFFERREQISLTSWLARQMTTFTAGGYMVAEGKSNPALDIARSLAYDDIEAAQIEEAQQRHASDGLVWGKDEDGKDVVVEVVPDTSRVASSADVMQAFGDPTKWRAR